MRNIFFCKLMIALLFISCNSSKKISGTTVEEKNTLSSLNGSWQLQMLFASDNTWARVPFITFNTAEKTFTGNSGCNSIQGRFTLSDSYIGIDKNIASTKMACLDQNSNRNEQTFLSALLKINKYTLTKDELELGQGEIVLMKFKRN